MSKNIYHSSGMYIGFILENAIFSRTGRYMGWLEEDNTAWDKNGKYRGVLEEHSGNFYILKNKFLLDPLPKISKVEPTTPAVPISPANVAPIGLGFDRVDGFDILSS